MHNPVHVLENDTHTLMGFCHTNGSPTLDQTTSPYNNQQEKKKKTHKIVDFGVPADHRIKLKEYEKRDKYLDLARELKKLRNMKVTIIPIVVNDFGMVTKGLLKGLEDLEVGGQVKTIQTTALKLWVDNTNNNKLTLSFRSITERKSENTKGKSLDLVRKLIKQRNVPKKLAKAFGRVGKQRTSREINRTAALLRLARLLRRIVMI